MIYHRSSYAASIEGVRRVAIASELDGGFRVALVGETKIGGQWLTVSLGKDYDSTKDGSPFALANLANLSVTLGDPALPRP